MVNDEKRSVAEIRCVINRIMDYSGSEINRWKDSIQAHKDEDPAVIAQLYIKVVEHTAEWNTAFLIANELWVKLDGGAQETDEQRQRSVYKRMEQALEEHQAAMRAISTAFSKSASQNDPSLSEITLHLAETESFLKNVLRRLPEQSKQEERKSPETEKAAERSATNG